MSDLELSNVTKAFGATRVIDRLSLSVRSNELVVFLGPSGCGKSTLLRMIAGLETLDEGEIRISGRRVDSLPPGERSVAMVFQHYALYPHMTVRENLSFGLRNVKLPVDEITRRVAQAVKMLEIEPLLDRKPGQISGGQRQRVAIGRAIVKEPRVFLFDEPLSNLDAALRMRTRVELAQLHRRVNASIIFVTHDQVEAMTLAQRIVVINSGRIEQIGTPMEIYARPATPFVAGLVGTPAINFAPARVAANGRLVSVELVDGSRINTKIGLDALPLSTALRLGIRAEAIKVVPPGQGQSQGSVKFVERLGDRTLVYVQLTDSLTMVAEDAGMSRIAIGDTVGLHYDGSAAHLFDNERGYHAAEAVGA